MFMPRAALALAIAMLAANCALAQAPPRHVFLIVIDSLRADHLPSYGYARNTAPFIATLAEEGVLFDQAFSASSYTRESIAALLTGRWPSATATGAGWDARPDPALGTLPEAFRAAGFATAFYTDTPMLGDVNFTRGFDEAIGLPDFGLSLQGGKVIDRAKDFLTRHADKNTFIYLHLLDPHSPYGPPADYYARMGRGNMPPAPVDMLRVRSRLRELRAQGLGPGDPLFEDILCRYDAEILYQDDLLRGLAGWLRETGRWEHTALALTADHGEEFLDHGYFEHAWRLYVESIRVPLLFWAGPRLQPGREAAPVSTVGLYPTLLALAGIDPGARAFDFGPLLRPEGGLWRAHAPGGPIIAELQLPERNMMRSIIDGGLHYIASQQWLSAEACADAGIHTVQRRLRDEFRAGLRPRPDPWGPPVKEELFDLARDPREQHDLAASDPQALARMRAAMEAYRAACTAR